MAKSRRQDRLYAVDLNVTASLPSSPSGSSRSSLPHCQACSTCAIFASTPHLTPSWMGHPPI